MNTQTIMVGAVMLLLGGITGFFVANSAGNGAGLRGEKGAPDNQISMGEHRMHGGEMMGNYGEMGSANGMDHMMSMMVESEREFIEGMIPHHQEAIDTAKEVLARGGTTEEIRTLAQNIIAAQEKEITDMKLWYEAWYGEAYKNTEDYAPMMRDLSLLSGAALDEAFLEDMVMHHMGAIMMAKSVQPYIEHQEIEALVKAVITTQSEEIRQMHEMLRGL